MTDCPLPRNLNRIHLILYLSVTVLLLFFLYANNLSWLWLRWMESPDYSHGPLIPLISLFVVFQKRKVLKRIKFDGSSLGIYILLCAILLQAVALRAQVNFLSSYSIILAIVGIVLYLFGKKMLSELLFPILFLFFMVPFWGVITNNLSNLLKILSSFSSSYFTIHRISGTKGRGNSALCWRLNGSC